MLTARQEVLHQVLRIAKDFQLVNPTLESQEAMKVAHKDFRHQMMEETRGWKKENLSLEFQLIELDKEVTELANAIKNKYGITKPESRDWKHRGC